MKELFLSVVLACFLPWGAWASVTDVKWGVDAKGVLRVVADLTEPAKFDFNIKNDLLELQIKTPWEGNDRVLTVGSVYADNIKIQAAGEHTKVLVMLKKPLSRNDVRAFTLKVDPQTKRPSRIVMDVFKKTADLLVAAVPAQDENVKITVNPPTDSADTQIKTVVEQGTGTKLQEKQPNTKEMQVAAVKGAGTGVKAKDQSLARIDKIPEFKRRTLPTSETTVVGSQPVRSTVPKVTVGKDKVVAEVPKIVVTGSGVKGSSTPGSKPVPSTAAKVTVGKNKVVPAVPKVVVAGGSVKVGNSPSNQTEAQKRASQRNKEAVDAILGKMRRGTVEDGKLKDEKREKGSQGGGGQSYQPALKVENAPVPPENVVTEGGAKAEAKGENVRAGEKVRTGEKVQPEPQGKISGETEVPVQKPVVSVVTQIPDVQIAGKDSGKKEKSKDKVVTSGYRIDGGIKGKIITIDPGHGGSDPGAVSDKNNYEKTITLAMAKKLKADLEKVGAKVFLTRSTDRDVAKPGAGAEEELQARVDIAEKNKSDLFISLHINSSVNKNAGGISTYFYRKTEQDAKLAKCIHKQLISNFKMRDMGVREDIFYVIKCCSMPAVLMELGFLSNKKEEKTVRDNSFQNKSMQLIAEGIKDYFN